MYCLFPPSDQNGNGRTGVVAKERMQRIVINSKFGPMEYRRPVLNGEMYNVSRKKASC